MVRAEADPGSHGAGTAGEPAAAVQWLRGDPCPAPGPGGEGPPPTGHTHRPCVPILLLGGEPLGTLLFWSVGQGITETCTKSQRAGQWAFQQCAHPVPAPSQPSFLLPLPAVIPQTQSWALCPQVGSLWYPQGPHQGGSSCRQAATGPWCWFVLLSPSPPGRAPDSLRASAQGLKESEHSTARVPELLPTRLPLSASALGPGPYGQQNPTGTLGGQALSTP